MILDTPNSLTLSKYMTDCYDSLHAKREFPSDATLPRMIRLAQLGNQTHTMLKLENSDNFDADDFWVRMHLKSLQSHLKGLETQGRTSTNDKGKQSLG